MTTKYVLTIAGSDVLSGGGLQADLATFTRHGLFGFVAQTCMTSLDQSGFEIIPTDLTVFDKQLSSLSTVPFSAIKIGLLPTLEMIERVKVFLRQYQDLPIVLDPVLVFKENQDQTISLMRDQLIALMPQVTLVTPNLKEAELLSGQVIKTMSDMEQAALVLQDLGAKRLVIKGGARLDRTLALDLYADETGMAVLSRPIISRQNHGAGCTFASSIAAALAKGCQPLAAVKQAKDDVYEAIAHATPYGVQGLPKS